MTFELRQVHPFRLGDGPFERGIGRLELPQHDLRLAEDGEKPPLHQQAPGAARLRHRAAQALHRCPVGPAQDLDDAGEVDFRAAVHGPRNLADDLAQLRERPVRLSKEAEPGLRLGAVAEKPDRAGADLPEALEPPQPGEPLLVRREARQHLARPAAQDERLRGGEIRLADAALNAVGGRRPVQGLGRLQRLLEAAVRAVEIAQMQENVRDALRIALFHGEFPRFQQWAERLAILSYRTVCGAHAHAQVDRLGERFGRPRQSRHGDARLLQKLCGRRIGRALLGPARSEQEVMRRRLPLLGAEGMLRQLLDVVRQRTGIELRHCCEDRAVQLPAVFPQQGVVGGTEGQRVLEGVFGVREALHLEQELKLLQAGERRIKVDPSQEILKQRARDVAADDGGDLQHLALDFAELPDARGDDRLY